jgi:hypothetical protein
MIGPFHGGTQTPESSILYGDVNAGKLGLALNSSSSLRATWCGTSSAVRTSSSSRSPPA